VDNLYQINPVAINDLAQAKVILKQLLNVLETFTKENKELKQLIQALRDEISRLKGEKGKPQIKPNNNNNNNNDNGNDTQNENDISSNKERKEKKSWKKTGKKNIIKIDKTVECPVDKTILPPDAQFKGHDRVVGQHIIFKRENTEYLVELYYSPSENKTYRGKLPDEYSGYFSKGLRSFTLLAHHCLDITRNKLLNLYGSIGIEMSKGSLNNILQEDAQKWTDEKDDLLRAGLLQGVAQTDVTGARVNGKNHYTHIICGEHFTVYSTLPGKSRQDVLRAFQAVDETGLLYQYNTHTLQLLEHFKISEEDKDALSKIYAMGQIVPEAEFINTIKEKVIALYNKKNMFRRVCDAFALAHFYELGILKILVSDDAREYELITLIRMLCWIHDGRHYKKLTPGFDYHRQILRDFLDKYWKYYHRLLYYTRNPQPELVAELENDFDSLFNPVTDYSDLNKEINRTLSNKEKLLTLLQYPFLPLHNNLSELAARRQVRKRDISLHTKTSLGTKLQDAFMSITQTCLQLNVDVWQYIQSRFDNTASTYLPEMVRMKYDTS